jgi:hypothetical protein
MRPASTSSTATSISTSQRRLIVGIVIVTLVASVIVIVELARGGRPDPPALRAAATLLDGSWRFHTGDAPLLADPTIEDGGWETIDLTAPPGSHDGDVGLPDYVSGWMAHGHLGYTGYAWYRRVVNVPAGEARWDILGPTAVDDGYELYWNGQLLGGSGTLGPDPRVVSTRPLRFTLPADAAGKQGILAIRVFMLPRPPQQSSDSGGIRSPPILAPQPVSDGLYFAHWERTIAGYIVDAIEPVVMFLLIGLMLWGWSRSGHRGFLILVSVALALTAERRLNNALVAWTDLMDLRTYSWLAKYMWIPTVAAWLLAWNRWSSRPWRIIDVSAVVLAIAAIIGTATNLPTVTTGSRIAFIALFVFVGVCVIRSGPMRILSALILVLIVLTLFSGELLDPIGVPGIWFPFNIGVSRTQYLYAIIIPLLAILIVRAPGKATQN